MLSHHVSKNNYFHIIKSKQFRWIVKGHVPNIRQVCLFPTVFPLSKVLPPTYKPIHAQAEVPICGAT